MVLWGVISFLEGKLPTLHLVQLCELLPEVLKDEKAASLKVNGPLYSSLLIAFLPSRISHICYLVHGKKESSTLQKQISYVNHSMVTLVADKLNGKVIYCWLHKTTSARCAGGFHFETYSLLFTQLVQSKILTNACIWGHKDYRRINSLQTQAMRFFLGVGRELLP